MDMAKSAETDFGDLGMTLVPASRTGYQVSDFAFNRIDGYYPF